MQQVVRSLNILILKVFIQLFDVFKKGELKDYMLIYMDDSDYNNLVYSFDYFQGA